MMKSIRVRTTKSMIQMVAARQVLCHLQWLAAEGLVCKVEGGWTLTGE